MSAAPLLTREQAKKCWGLVFNQRDGSEECAQLLAVLNAIASGEHEVRPAPSGAASVSANAAPSELLRRVRELGDAEAEHEMNGGQSQVPRETYSRLVYELTNALLDALYAAPPAAPAGPPADIKPQVRRYTKAVAALFDLRTDGPPLHERSPSKDGECYAAFIELNDAGKALTLAAQILADSDDPQAGPDLAPSPPMQPAQPAFSMLDALYDECVYIEGTGWNLRLKDGRAFIAGTVPRAVQKALAALSPDRSAGGEPAHGTDAPGEQK